MGDAGSVEVLGKVAHPEITATKPSVKVIMGQRGAWSKRANLGNNRNLFLFSSFVNNLGTQSLIE
jgi:hypothetical protein